MRNKGVQLTLWVTEEERETLKQKAASTPRADGRPMTMSEYIRFTALYK